MKIIFAGTPSFAIPALQELLSSSHQICAVYTRPDKPAGRGLKLTPSPIKEFAQSHNLPLYQPSTLKNEPAHQQLTSFNADILVNVAYGMILPDTILAIPKFGGINIHPSLLPRWRGAAPIQRAILAGDEETGVTIMQIDAGLDTGGIYKQARIPILSTDTSATLFTQMADLGAKLLIEVLAEIETGKIAITPQSESGATYANKITKEEGEISWQLSSPQLDRMIRAFNPWPIAFTKIDGNLIRIWEATTHDEINSSSTPGTIIAASADGIDVKTNPGVLRLHKIQLPGGKPLPVKDVLNAHRGMFAPGKKFT